MGRGRHLSRSNRGSIVLITLILGLLSTEIDVFHDHSASPRTVNKHSEYNAAACHLVAGEFGKEAPPCNACFFRNILGQVLLPVGHNLNPVIRGILYSDVYRNSFVYCSFDINVNRGPPSSRFI
jgi:hypothetical protein